jgi:hypothetical protein
MIAGVNQRMAMRSLILALLLAGVAGVAVAQDNGAPSGTIRTDAPPPRPPASARKQAEEAIRHGLADPDGAQFRSERTSEVASVRRGAFGERIAGPVSVVCGQFSSRDQTGGQSGYAWFFVAIKHGEVLWSDVDRAADGPGVAYAGCRGAGLAE